MSSAKIVAQGNPQQVIGLPTVDLRLPTLLHVRVQMTGGAPVLVFGRDTTTGLYGTTIDTTATVAAGAGLFDFGFNPCRGFLLGTFSYVYLPNANGTDKFNAYIDKTSSFTNTNGTTGKLRVVTSTAAAGTPATPPDGSEFHFSLWADLG